MLDHTDLVNRARGSRQALGYEVYTENQNSFRLRGKNATLPGKPDLIAVKRNGAVIIDAKTGWPSPHHTVQVMVYQYAVSLALEEYREMEFTGGVAHPTLPSVQRRRPRLRGGQAVQGQPEQPDPKAGGGQTGPAAARESLNKSGRL